MNVTIEGVEYVPAPPKLHCTARIHDIFYKARQHAKWTLAEASTYAGVSPSSAAKAERKGEVINIETAVKLADVYGIPLELIAQAVRGLRK